MRIQRLFVLPVIGLAALLGACGNDTSGSATTRTIDITMTDNAYTPAAVTVAKGENVTLRFHNTGKLAHEAVLGDEAYQMDHGTTMTGSATTMGGMSHGVAMDDRMITVMPGKTGSMSYMFDQAGTMLIGCHQPGHYEAGMKAMVTVQ